jgi:hypothetical protein
MIYLNHLGSQRAWRRGHRTKQGVKGALSAIEAIEASMKRCSECGRKVWLMVVAREGLRNARDPKHHDLCERCWTSLKDKQRRHKEVTVRTFTIGLLLLGLTGCGTVSTVGYPTGDGTYMVLRTVTDPHSMSASIQRNWREVCQTRTHNGYTNCTELPGTEQFVSSQGYVATLAGPVMQTGAIVGGAYYIGKGLSKSGTTNNNNTQSGAGAGASASSNQHQGQHSVNLNESFNGKNYQY